MVLDVKYINIKPDLRLLSTRSRYGPSCRSSSKVKSLVLISITPVSTWRLFISNIRKYWRRDSSVYWLGFNVTVLAYGQTGSGKTHTMGTAYRLMTSFYFIKMSLTVTEFVMAIEPKLLENSKLLLFSSVRFFLQVQHRSRRDRGNTKSRTGTVPMSTEFLVCFQY